MTSSRRRAIAVSMTLLIFLALGILFLVRLGTDPDRGSATPSTIFSDATPRTSSSDPTVADDAGTNNERGKLGHSDGRSPSTTVSRTRTTSTEAQPAPAVVRIGPLDSISSQSFVTGGLLYAEFSVDHPFSARTRVVDVYINQLGKRSRIGNLADRNSCRRGLAVEPEKTGYLCTVTIPAPASGEPGNSQGEIGLTLQTTCTSKSGQPCRNLPDGYDPSPENPIDVTWDSGHATKSISRAEAQPPRPAARLSSVGGIGARVLKDAGGSEIQFYANDTFSVQVRIVQVNLSQPGDELVIDASADDRCRPGVTVEAGMKADPLCVVRTYASESAEDGQYTGKLELVFEATCTSKVGRPCQNLPERYDPSPDNPVVVTWNQYSTVQVAKIGTDESPSSGAGPPP